MASPDNTPLMAAIIVMIVASIGLAAVHSESAGLTGAAFETEQGMPFAQEAGQRCGQCAMDYSNTKEWDYNRCPRMVDMSEQYGITAQRLTYQCCLNECDAMLGGYPSDKFTWRCGQVCRGAASGVFGYTRYAGGYPE